MTPVLERNRLLILVWFLLIVPCALAQQSQGAKSLRLERLEFEGLKRYERDQIAEASGLKIGLTVNEAVLDEAANRLVQSGFFANVTYRLRATGGQATVTFQLEEKAEKGLPVVFDNFVWFGDEDLANVIRREMPSYDGTALETGNMTDNIKSILQRLLQEKKIPGQVEYMPSADPSGAVVAHVYTIKGIKIPICEVGFTGASAIKDDELKENSKPIFNDDFSRGIVVGFANLTLGEVYRQRGYLRARFNDVSVKTIENAGCKNGVAVMLTVDEGLQYLWEKAEWLENNALSVQELDAALGMKNGEVASITKINKGLFQVNRAFGRKGYIGATLRPIRDFDDANKRVTFRFKVIEGAEYKMGALAIQGLPDETAAHLKSLWKLSVGDVYDASYVDDFLTLVAKDTSYQKARANMRGAIDVSSKPDRQSLRVNVNINFK